MNDTVLKDAPQGHPKRVALRYRSINKVRITGRLTHNPEVRSAIGDKLIVHMDLALNRAVSRQGRQSAPGSHLCPGDGLGSPRGRHDRSFAHGKPGLRGRQAQERPVENLHRRSPLRLESRGR